MHDFIQTSDFTHNYLSLTFAIIIFLISIAFILTAIILKIKKTTTKMLLLIPPFLLVGTVFLLVSILIFSIEKNSYAEYTGKFKIVDSTTNRVYKDSEPSIVIKDKNNHEQTLPVNDGTIYHKGDIAKVKIYVMKHHKPSLIEKIDYDDTNNKPSGAHTQTLKSIEKVK